MSITWRPLFWSRRWRRVAWGLPQTGLMAETRSRLAVRRALGVVYERLKNEDGVLATYRAWMKAGAKTPLPYNRVGEILEKRQDHKAALDAFIRSLQIEWNQPPTIEARKDCSRRPTRPIDENERMIQALS